MVIKPPLTYSPASRQRNLPLRASVALLAALFLAIVAIGGFTIKLLNTERKALEETQREADAHAIALLSSKVEQTIFATLRAPLASLRNVAESPTDAAYLRDAVSMFPIVNRALLFDSQFRLHDAYPNIHAATTTRIAALAGERVSRRAADQLDIAPYTFTDNADRTTLFSVAPVNVADEPGWIVFDVDIENTTRDLAPLFAEFNASQEGIVTLQEPNAPWDDGALNWPIGNVLPGWLLSFNRDERSEDRQIERERALVLSITGAIILTMVMTTFAVWRELGRAHAMTEMRNQFIANVSHELRTPLTLIRMYSETLALGRIDDREKQRQYHLTIVRESERLTRMIDNVLDFAQLRQGQRNCQLTSDDLAASVRNTLQDYRERIAEGGLHIDEIVSHDIPPIRHDPDGIRQILINLLDNANKYARPSGKVSVTLHGIDGAVELAVADDGPGIPDSERSALVKPFVRGPDTQISTGSGLGLYIVDHVAKAHGGTLSLESGDNGQGLRVRIVFPVAQTET